MKHFAAGWILLALLLPQTTAAFTLYVFYPSEVRPKSLEGHLARHCEGIQVTAFAQVEEFNRSLERSPPDAILSLPPVIEQSPGYSSVVQGSRRGSTVEEYYLVSRPPPLEKAALASVDVGVVDLLGRRAMQSFINEKLATEVRIKRVTKLEDILPLLTFRHVEAVFVSSKDYDILKQRTTQPLVATPADIRLGLIGVAVKDTRNSSVLAECFERLDPATNALLGVDRWLPK